MNPESIEMTVVETHLSSINLVCIDIEHVASLSVHC